MKLYRIVVGPIQENCYLIKNEETGEGIIIDPGDEALKIMEAVKKAGIKKITAIFITHGHGDHISALDEVKKLTGAKVYIEKTRLCFAFGTAACRIRQTGIRLLIRRTSILKTA